MFVLSAFVILIDLLVTVVERRLLVWRPDGGGGPGVETLVIPGHAPSRGPGIQSSSSRRSGFRVRAEWRAPE